jgi:hypothetical protein
LLPAALLAVVLAADVLGVLALPVPLDPLDPPGVAGWAGAAVVGVPETSVVSPTSMVSSDVAARNW